MSIFTFETKSDKEVRKNQSVFEKSLDRAIKKAEIDDKKIEEFFKSEGATIFLDYLKNEKDICLRAMREAKTNEIRLQERYAVRCADIEMIETYVSRVKPT